MFKSHHSGKKSSGSFVIFRLLLSLIIFLVMLVGLYSAYREFSGFDPLQIDPKAVALNLASTRDPTELINKLSQLTSLKSEENIAGQSGDMQIAGVTEKTPSIQGQDTANKTPAFSFLLLSDSHNENNYLKKALEQGRLKAKNMQFVIGLGDYTEVGTKEELLKAKKEFDEFGVRYFLVPGDHDLWDGRDKTDEAISNFIEVFGKPYQTFTSNNVRFFLIYNSDNYMGLGDEQKNWLEMELVSAKLENPQATFVFLHEPLYHPSSSRIMGKVEDKLKSEAKDLIRLLKNNGVNEVFAGDIHFYTRYTEPETGLQMTTLGAIASLRNTQNPRYGIVTVYTDGSYSVEDMEIN